MSGYFCGQPGLSPTGNMWRHLRTVPLVTREAGVLTHRPSCPTSIAPGTLSPLLLYVDLPTDESPGAGESTQAEKKQGTFTGGGRQSVCQKLTLQQDIPGWTIDTRGGSSSISAMLSKK